MVTSGFDSTRAALETARAAQDVVGCFADGVSALTTAVTGGGSGDAQAAIAAGTGLRHEITQIGLLAESALRAAVEAAEGKDGSAKVMSVIASVVIVVVAVIVAVFTFGAASGLLALAVIAAAAIIGAATAAAEKTTGELRGIALEIALGMMTSQSILKTLQTATDKEQGRKVAMTDLAVVLRSVTQTSASIRKVPGACGADLQTIRFSCDRIDASLASLVAYLRRLRLAPSSDGQALVETLERVRRAFGESRGALLK